MGRCLVTCPFPSSACRASSSVSLPLLLSCCFRHVLEEKSCPSRRLSLPAGAKRRTNKIVQNAQNKNVQPVGTALPRSPRGPWQCRANSLDDFNLVGSVYKPHLGPHDLPTCGARSCPFFLSAISGPSGFSGFVPGFRARVSCVVSFGEIFCRTSDFSTRHAYFSLFLRRGTPGCFSEFSSFFLFFRVFVRRFLFTALIFPLLRIVFC